MFATVVMVHLKLREHRGDDDRLAAWKFRLTRRLYERGYRRRDVRSLFRFIDWLMRLPIAREQQFYQRLRSYERERQMPYLSTWERKALEEGLQKGRLGALLRLLRARFGDVPDELKVRLKTVDAEQLDGLIDAAVAASSLDASCERIPPGN